MILLKISQLSEPYLHLQAPEVPLRGEYYMPQNTDSFADGLWHILRTAIGSLRPDLMEAAGICFSIIAVVLLVSILSNFADNVTKVAEMVGIVSVGTLLLGSTNSMVRLGTETVTELKDYGKLFFPVMTTALAAQGALTSSAALYSGTILVNSLIGTLISRWVVPLIYIFLALSIAGNATHEELVCKIQEMVKKASVWILRSSLYVFTAYIGITGVISGTTDAATMKAAKLTISGAIPVVGGILSEASEAVVVGVGVMKNATGIYGLFAVLAVCIGPFLKIGVHYLLLKLTASVCSAFGKKQTVSLLDDFTAAMGVVLAMVGTMCLLLLISTVCFMRGVG